MAAERDVLLQKINAHSFVADDLKLFLDTHPGCADALAALNKHLAARAEAVKAYEAAFGPITAEGQRADGAFAWIDGPWPWETEG